MRDAQLAKRFPNAVLVHTPVHASWLNQVEIYFSVIQRKVVSPNDSTSLDQVEQRLTDFEQRYNATARPFPDFRGRPLSVQPLQVHRLVGEPERPSGVRVTG